MDKTISINKQVYEPKKKSPYWVSVVLFFITLIAACGTYLYYYCAVRMQTERTQEFLQHSLSNKTERILLYVQTQLKLSQDMAKASILQEAFSKLTAHEPS